MEGTILAKRAERQKPEALRFANHSLLGAVISLILPRRRGEAGRATSIAARNSQNSAAARSSEGPRPCQKPPHPVARSLGSEITGHRSTSRTMIRRAHGLSEWMDVNLANPLGCLRGGRTDGW